MTIKEKTEGTLQSLETDANKYLTNSAIRYRLEDLGEVMGGNLVKQVSHGGGKEDPEIVLEVGAGEEKEYGDGYIFVGS